MNRNNKNYKRWLLTPLLVIATSAKAFVPAIPAAISIVILICALVIEFHWEDINNSTVATPTTATPTIDPFAESLHKHKHIVRPHQPASPPESRHGDCTYSKIPETTARVGDDYLTSYPYLVNSLIIKEIESSQSRPYSDNRKWMADAGGARMSVRRVPFHGAYVVDLATPITAVQAAALIDRMFMSDAPKPLTDPKAQATVLSRCRYDYIEVNWVVNTQQNPESKHLHNPESKRLHNPRIDGPDKLQIINAYYPGPNAAPNSMSMVDRFKACFGVCNQPLMWDWLGGEYSQYSDIAPNQNIGSNFVDGWARIKEWTKIDSHRLQTIPIAVVDSQMLDVNVTSSLHNVKFEKYFSLNRDGSVVEGNASCRDLAQAGSCHGQLVASVLSADTNSGNTTGNPGALGMGVNYGEKDANNISKFPIAAIQIGGIMNAGAIPNWNNISNPQFSDLTSLVFGIDVAIFGPNNQMQVVGGEYITPLNRVINISLSDIGFPCSIHSSRYFKFLRKATNDAVVIVMSASNGGAGMVNRGSVAGCEGIISAVAHDRNGNSHPDANRGTDRGLINQFNYRSLSAPGMDLRLLGATFNYGYLSGTSFAAPQISAAAALMLALDPQMSAQNIYEIISDTGEPFDRTSNNRYGVALNAGAAIAQVIKNLKSREVGIGIPPIVKKSK